MSGVRQKPVEIKAQYLPTSNTIFYQLIANIEPDKIANVRLTVSDSRNKKLLARDVPFATEERSIGIPVLSEGTFTLDVAVLSAGGKTEPGETPEQGLAREIAEEFEIEIKVGDFIGSHCFSNGDIEYELMAYYAYFVSGDMVLHVHDEVRWVSLEQMDAFDFAESDRSIIRIMKDNN